MPHRLDIAAPSLVALALAMVAGCAAVHAPPEPAPPPDVTTAAIEDEEPAAPPAWMRPPRPLDGEGAFYVLAEDPAHPRVRYLDGQTSANDSCPILRGNKLSRKVPPMYVNGRPVGFC